jgi:hypothetical protein
MVLVISHSHAHRLLKGGTIQSAPFLKHGIGAEAVYTIREKDFCQRDPVEMNLTGGDQELIRNDLERMNQVLQEDYRLPSTTSTVVEQQSAEQVL